MYFLKEMRVYLKIGTLLLDPFLPLNITATSDKGLNHDYRIKMYLERSRTFTRYLFRKYKHWF